MTARLSPIQEAELALSRINGRLVAVVRELLGSCDAAAMLIEWCQSSDEKMRRGANTTEASTLGSRWQRGGLPLIVSVKDAIRAPRVAAVLTTGVSHATAAVIVGMSSPSQLHRAFRRRYGLTVTQWSERATVAGELEAFRAMLVRYRDPMVQWSRRRDDQQERESVARLEAIRRRITYLEAQLTTARRLEAESVRARLKLA